MANFINDLSGKIPIWEHDISHYRQEYADAQAEIASINSQISSEMANRNDGSDAVLKSLEFQKSCVERKMSKVQLEVSKISVQISLALSQINDKMAKIERAFNDIVKVGSINKYGKAGLSASSTKAELQNMKSALLQLAELKTKLTELSGKCDLGRAEETPKVKSIWRDTDPYTPKRTIH